MSDRALQRLPIFLPHLAVFGVGSLLIVAFLLLSYHFLQDPFSFNSDQLYTIHFCDDLLHGRDMQGWHVPAAPYFFPDMVLLLVCLALTSNIAAIFILYALLFYALLLAALMAVRRNVGLPWRQAFMSGGLSLAFFWAVHFDLQYANHGILLFYPGNHMGCLLVGLAVLALVLHAARKGYGWLSAILLVALCVLTGSSDQLLIAQCLAPICSAVLLLGLCRLILIRRALTTMVLLGGSAWLAMKGRLVFIKLGLVPLRIINLESKPLPDFSAVGADFLANFRHAIEGQPLMCFVLAFHVVAGLVVLARWLPPGRRGMPADDEGLPAAESPLDRPTILLAALVLLLAPVWNAVALIVTGTSEEAAVIRYLYTWWILPFLFLLLWPRLLPWRKARLAPWAAVAVVAFRLAAFPYPLSVDHFAARYPPLAQAVDDMVRKHGPMRGLADYWMARELHYLTHSHVEVVPIFPPGMPRFHAFNPNTFLSEDPHDLSIPAYHFLVMSREKPEPDPEHALRRYGKPAEIIPAGKYEIWRYDRLVSRAFDLFLRAKLAQRLVRAKPFVGPSQPATLAKPKAERTPWEHHRNVHLEAGKSLTLRFDRPVTGAMVNLSANFMDQYVLEFGRDGKKLGATRVPPVEWTGMEFGYGPPGLQSRLVPVPPAGRTEGFNEVRVIPVGSATHYTLGHFLVFEEWIPCQSGWEHRYEPYHRYEGEKMQHAASPAVVTVEDPAASNGRARQADSTFQGYLAYGPYTIVAPGRYRVDFALQVDDNNSTDVVATIDSCAFIGEQVLHRRPLRGREFPSANKYTVFSFYLNAEDELDLVEFRVEVHAKTKVTLDYIDVTRIAEASGSDER